MLATNAVVFFIIVLSFFSSFSFAQPRLPQEEVDALQQIATTMGAKYWKFNADSCQLEMVGVTPERPKESQSEVVCDCNFQNNTVCHVSSIMLKGYSLPGVLPPELVKLPQLQFIDFAYNYLSGKIPGEWGSTRLNSISLLGNRLSGEIPKELGNITSLTYLNLEANNFSGDLPPDLGKLINLSTLILSSNYFTGKLPTTFSELRNLTDFRINDNSFNGAIPEMIQNWKQLTKLEMHASGLEGPIPSSISLLDNLTDLRISDINGTAQELPVLENITGIVRLVLRNCSLSGEIPPYIWNLMDMEMLDLSFNRLVGEIPDDISGRRLKSVFLTRNMLSGNIPKSMKDKLTIDLSYNNFTWQGPDHPACQKNLNRNINMFKSFSAVNLLRGFFPCIEEATCPKYGCSLHVDCGGNSLTVKENNKKVAYEGDAEEDGSAKYFTSDSNWGFSSTGDFMDDDNQNYVESVPSTNITELHGSDSAELYSTARISPISLTYFHYCLENGRYNVSLHFAEILFTKDNTTYSLGRRFFDIYIQEKLVQKDFNVEYEARGALRPLVKHFNASVTDNILEIRLYWAAKGTTRFPRRGAYGSLISAVSVDPYFKSCSNKRRKENVTAYAIVGAIAGCIVIVLIFGIL